uniref:Uncharacterized protein n=1 Tax=Cacopsylla melanoneura TaxID=428564 RepID=A0A8D9AU04_9HEMI
MCSVPNKVRSVEGFPFFHLRFFVAFNHRGERGVKWNYSPRTGLRGIGGIGNGERSGSGDRNRHFDYSKRYDTVVCLIVNNLFFQELDVQTKQLTLNTGLTQKNLKDTLIDTGKK